MSREGRPQGAPLPVCLPSAARIPFLQIVVGSIDNRGGIGYDPGGSPGELVWLAAKAKAVAPGGFSRTICGAGGRLRS